MDFAGRARNARNVAPSSLWSCSDWLSTLAPLIGLMGGCAQILLTIAYRSAPVSVVAPFDYMALVYGLILGFIFFAEIPDGYLLVGGATVVASGIYIVHREAVVARERRRRQPAPPLPADA